MELKKSERNKSILIYLIGIYFLVLGVLAILNSLFYHVPYQILYACYIGIILIGTGILMRNSYLILSQLYILTIPLFMWDIDFVYQLILRRPLWGLTNYFFSEISTFLDSFITLQHLYTIPLALYAIHLIGVKRKDAWKWSFVQWGIMFFIVTIFSPRELNINCVFFSCININYGLPYIVAWFLISFSWIGLTAVIINYFLWRKRHF